MRDLSVLQFPSHGHRRDYVWYPGLDKRIVELMFCSRMQSYIERVSIPESGSLY